MNPQCALQMRSTFGDRHFMQETGSFWGREPRSSTFPKKIMKEDQKSHMGMQTLGGRWGWSYLENDDTRGKHIELSTCNKAFGNRRPCEYKVCESWFLVERCTANRYACIECGRCQTFITKNKGDEKGGSLTRKKFTHLEGIQLNPEEWRNSQNIKRVVGDGPYQISEGGSGNSRPKAPQPHGGTPEHRTKMECNREQKKDVVTRWNAVTAARGDQSTL